MTEEAEMVLEMAEESMKNTIEHFERDLHKIRAGKASPSMLDGISIDNYGSKTPLNQVANISTPDARTLMVQPWDKANLIPIEKEIINSNLGFNPQNDGSLIRINVPVLTEERRLGLVKKAKSAEEDAKIGMRNARRSANDETKQLEKDGLSEDVAKKLSSKIDDLTHTYYKNAEKLFEDKERDITSI
ncbi:MAG: ribosome recycling factor [Bacteroidales bacterium]|nr:ribosome recycling factor [Bacteroidales bacterium]